MDAAFGTKTCLITPMKGRYPDFIVKCGHCGAEIGVVKTEQRIDPFKAEKPKTDRGDTAIRRGL